MTTIKSNFFTQFVITQELVIARINLTFKYIEQSLHIIITVITINCKRSFWLVKSFVLKNSSAQLLWNEILVLVKYLSTGIVQGASSFAKVFSNLFCIQNCIYHKATTQKSPLQRKSGFSLSSTTLPFRKLAIWLLEQHESISQCCENEAKHCFV